MKVCVYKKKFVRIAHVWFCETDDLCETVNKLEEDYDADFYYMHGIDNSIQGRNNVISEKQLSLLTYLDANESELFEKVRKNIRYEIKKASKDNIKCCYYTCDEFFEQKELYQMFITLYNQMYESKGIKGYFNQTLVKKYSELGMISFSVAFFDDEPLVFHAYLHDDSKIRLYYSTSALYMDNGRKKLIGVANKALHWFDIGKFKSMGYAVYDWGGISSFANPNGIDKFKMGFGGSEIVYNNVFFGKSFLGKCILKLKRFLDSRKKCD